MSLRKVAAKHRWWRRLIQRPVLILDIDHRKSVLLHFLIPISPAPATASPDATSGNEGEQDKST